MWPVISEFEKFLRWEVVSPSPLVGDGRGEGAPATQTTHRKNSQTAQESEFKIQWGSTPPHETRR